MIDISRLYYLAAKQTDEESSQIISALINYYLVIASDGLPITFEDQKMINKIKKEKLK